MADFEEKVKAAFDAEFERTRPRPGLRGRVIANAVAWCGESKAGNDLPSSRDGNSRRDWYLPHELRG